MAREWRDDLVTGLAAEVAFFGLLSLFPTLIATAAALGSLQSVVGQAVAERAESAVVDFLSGALTSEAQGTVDAVRQLFTTDNAGLFTFGLLAALWTTSRGFAAVVNALDAAYDVNEVRSLVALRLRGLGLALGSIAVGALVLAMIVLGPLLGGGRDVAEALGLGRAFATTWDWVRLPLAGAIMVSWAATLFHLAPNHRTPWRWDVPGALLSAGLWATFSVGLRLYLVVAAGSNQVFGVVGGILIVVLWLYLMALALILGAELNAILAARAGVVQEPRPGGGGRLRRVVTRAAERARGWVGRRRRDGGQAPPDPAPG